MTGHMKLRLTTPSPKVVHQPFFWSSALFYLSKLFDSFLKYLEMWRMKTRLIDTQVTLSRICNTNNNA